MFKVIYLFINSILTPILFTFSVTLFGLSFSEKQNKTKQNSITVDFCFFNIAFLLQFSIKELKISGSFIDLTQMKYYDKATVLHVMQFLVLIFKSSMNVFALQKLYIYIYMCVCVCVYIYLYIYLYIYIKAEI